MSSLSFESVEQILGVELNTANSGGQVTEINDKDVFFIEKSVVPYCKEISEHINTLRKVTDEYLYVNDLIEDLCKRNAINKAYVNSINESFPELLTNVAHINDFTDILSKTNIAVIQRFLDGKKNQLKDNIYVIYKDNIFNTAMSLFSSFMKVDHEGVNRDCINSLKEHFNSLVSNKELAIFKEGELLTLARNALSSDFIELVKKVGLKDIDTNKYLEFTEIISP